MTLPVQRECLARYNGEKSMKVDRLPGRSELIYHVIESRRVQGKQYVHFWLSCPIDFFALLVFPIFLFYCSLFPLQVTGKKKLKGKICCRTKRATRNRRITLTTRHVFFRIITITLLIGVQQIPWVEQKRLFLGCHSIRLEPYSSTDGVAAVVPS